MATWTHVLLDVKQPLEPTTNALCCIQRAIPKYSTWYRFQVFVRWKSHGSPTRAPWQPLRIQLSDGIIMGVPRGTLVAQ